MKTLPNYTLVTAAIALLASMNSVASETTIAVTAENFSHAETARNYRNWAAQGANKGFVILERVMGIEPTSKAWEAFVLPLNYTRIRRKIIIFQIVRRRSINTNLAETTRFMVFFVPGQRPNSLRAICYEFGLPEISVSQTGFMLVSAIGGSTSMCHPVIGEPKASGLGQVAAW